MTHAPKMSAPKTPALTVPLVAACALAAASVAWPLAASASECLTDWGAAARVIEKESLLTIDAVSQSAGKALEGQILKTTLCRERDGYVYRLVVRGPDGRMNAIVLDAENHGR
ncbi:MAG: PepSY domain-containing protein [Hyphomicrobium sp.]